MLIGPAVDASRRRTRLCTGENAEAEPAALKAVDLECVFEEIIQIRLFSCLGHISNGAQGTV